MQEQNILTYGTNVQGWLDSSNVNKHFCPGFLSQVCWFSSSASWYGRRRVGGARHMYATWSIWCWNRWACWEERVENVHLTVCFPTSVLPLSGTQLILKKKYISVFKFKLKVYFTDGTKYSATEHRSLGVDNVQVCLTLSCPGTGWAVVKIGHSNLWPGSKELSYLLQSISENAYIEPQRLALSSSSSCSCPDTGRVVVKIGHSKLRPGSKEVLLNIVKALKS